MVFQGIQAKFTGGTRSINPHLFSHPILISFPSAAVVHDALQKWIYSGAVKRDALHSWRDGSICHAWTDEAGARLLSRNRLPRTNLQVRIRCQHGVAFWSEGLIWKLACRNSEGKKKKKTNCGRHLPGRGCNRINTTKALSGSNHRPALPILRFEHRCQTPL